MMLQMELVKKALTEMYVLFFVASRQLKDFPYKNKWFCG
jgi:hypothetical protein